MHSARALLIIVALTGGCASQMSTEPNLPDLTELTALDLTLEATWSNALDLYCEDSPYAAAQLAGVEEDIRRAFFSDAYCPLIRDTNYWQDVAIFDAAGKALIWVDGAAAQHWGDNYQSCFPRGWGELVIRTECR
jgi:hypothetical protein